MDRSEMAYIVALVVYFGLISVVGILGICTKR